MSILKEIRDWIKKNGSPPWPVGVDLSKCSDEVKFISQLISEEELCVISKHNRLKGYRNQLIQEIIKRHYIPLEIVSKISGLSLPCVKSISAKRKNKNE